MTRTTPDTEGEAFMQCGRCGGSGKVPLPRYLAETYEWLRQHGPATAAQAAAGLRCGLTVAHNRLCLLGQLDLVVSSRGRKSRGRPSLYRVAGNPAPAEPVEDQAPAPKAKGPAGPRKTSGQHKLAQWARGELSRQSCAQRDGAGGSDGAR